LGRLCPLPAPALLLARPLTCPEGFLR
jgi:hypothetical protein